MPLFNFPVLVEFRTLDSMYVFILMRGDPCTIKKLSFLGFSRGYLMTYVLRKNTSRIFQTSSSLGRTNLSNCAGLKVLMFGQICEDPFGPGKYEIG